MDDFVMMGSGGGEMSPVKKRDWRRIWFWVLVGVSMACGVVAITLFVVGNIAPSDVVDVAVEEEGHAAVDDSLSHDLLLPDDEIVAEESEDDVEGVSDVEEVEQIYPAKPDLINVAILDYVGLTTSEEEAFRERLLVLFEELMGRGGATFDFFEPTSEDFTQYETLFDGGVLRESAVFNISGVEKYRFFDKIIRFNLSRCNGWLGLTNISGREVEVFAVREYSGSVIANAAIHELLHTMGFGHAAALERKSSSCFSPNLDIHKCLAESGFNDYGERGNILGTTNDNVPFMNIAQNYYIKTHMNNLLDFAGFEMEGRGAVVVPTAVLEKSGVVMRLPVGIEYYLYEEDRGRYSPYVFDTLFLGKTGGGISIYLSSGTSRYGYGFSTVKIGDYSVGDVSFRLGDRTITARVESGGLVVAAE